METIIIYIAIVLFLLTFKLIWDRYNKNKRSRIINHKRSSLIDVSIYTISSMLLFYHNDLYDLFKVCGMVILASSGRWILFDPIFGLINGNGIDWHGKSADMDVFLTKVGKYHFFIKLIPVAIGLGLILI